MVLIGIAAAAIIGWIILRWWTEGVFNGLEAVVLFVIYGGLVFGLFAVQDTAARVLVLLALMGSALWAILLVKQDSLKQYYRDRIRRYEDAIRADPANSAARSQMAEAYYQMGDLDSAIAAIELVSNSGREAVKNSYKLRQWVSERELRDSKTVSCQACNTRNIWGTVQCRTCMQPLIYPTNEGGLSLSSVRTRYLVVAGAWLLATVIVFLMMKPAQAAIVSTCFGLAGFGWGLLSSSKIKR